MKIKMNKEKYITQPQAKKLAALGFKAESEGYWAKWGNVGWKIVLNWGGSGEHYPAYDTHELLRELPKCFTLEMRPSDRYEVFQTSTHIVEGTGDEITFPEVHTIFISDTPAQALGDLLIFLKKEKLI